MPDHPTDPYREAIDKFVLLWGEMATSWGINKTMAQIHALLYAETRALDTDTIMEKLDISRGNANMNLRNLIQWNLIHKVHFKGQRKDYYTAEKDVWNIVSILISERQEREIAPIRENLQELYRKYDEESLETEDAREFKERIENFIEFLEMFERFTAALLPYINKRNLKFLKQLVKMAEAHQSFSKKQEKTSNPEPESDE